MKSLEIIKFWEETADTDFVRVTFLFRTVASQDRMVYAHTSGKWTIGSRRD